MLIVCASMPRSASLWYTHLMRDLYRASGVHETGITAHSERLGKRLPGAGRLEPWQLFKLVRNLGEHNVCMIRTHCRLSLTLRHLLNNHSARATFVYRDPRDVIVSALELGRKMREKGEARRYFGIGPYQSFARFFTLEGAIRWVKWQLFPRWKTWAKCNDVLLTRYEDLVVDTISELERLAAFLNLPVGMRSLEGIVEAYAPDKSGRIDGDLWKKGRGPMRNKGIVGRYKTSLTLKQQDLCNTRLAKCLKEMGYC